MLFQRRMVHICFLQPEWFPKTSHGPTRQGLLEFQECLISAMPTLHFPKNWVSQNNFTFITICPMNFQFTKILNSFLGWCESYYGDRFLPTSKISANKSIFGSFEVWRNGQSDLELKPTQNLEQNTFHSLVPLDHAQRQSSLNFEEEVFRAQKVFKIVGALWSTLPVEEGRPLLTVMCIDEWRNPRPVPSPWYLSCLYHRFTRTYSFHTMEGFKIKAHTYCPIWLYLYRFVIYLGSRTPFESPAPQVTTWTSQPVHWFFAFSSFSSAVRASIFCSRSVFCLFKSSFSVMSYSTSVSDGAPKLFLMNSMTLGGFSGSS